MPVKKNELKETTSETTTCKKTSATDSSKKEVKAVAKSTAKVEKKAKAPRKTKKAAKKDVAKKEPAKKAVKKTVKKAEKKEVKKEVVKKSYQEYVDVINWKKWEAHNMNWLYIEINANDLLTELEVGVDNMDTCCNAVKDCMLEGDYFIVEPKSEKDGNLSVRYYCDNLSESRRKWSEVN